MNRGIVLHATTKTVILTGLIVSLTMTSLAADIGKENADLYELSLEELMNIEVTSVSKKPQKLSETAAAVYVITSDDIRRSGATTIMDALRMVPGVNVGQLDSNAWAISIHGFNGRYANKLLVMVDGRSVYTPFFSGVLWEVQDIILNDIERIEVIRGPGSSMWGANAVNGVINIITKSAKDTQGGLVSANKGTEERGMGQIRYGGQLSRDAYYRIYAKYFDRDGFVDASGQDATDDWHNLKSGFRVDWDISHRDSLTMQGDYYDGEAGQKTIIPVFVPPFSTIFDETINMSGGSLLTRWNRHIDDGNDFTLQLYYDRTDNSQRLLPDYNTDILDIDFQHRFLWGKRSEVIWGLGYRLSSDNIDPAVEFWFDDKNRTSDVFNVFVQDEIALIRDELLLTFGSKFEHNEYTGFEVQPNTRIAWMPNERHTLWAAISRAVRTPSRVERGLTSISPGTADGVFATFFGSRDSLPEGYDFEECEQEELLAYESGYRVQFSDQSSVDVVSFYNVYDNLRTVELGTPFISATPQPHLALPFTAGNNMSGKTYGIEAVLRKHLLKWWNMESGYSFFKMQLKLDANSLGLGAEGTTGEGEAPQNQLFMKSSMNLPSNMEFDLQASYTDNLPSIDIGSYITLNARLGWKPRENLELYIVGQNLLDDHHPEFVSKHILIEETEVERSLYIGASWLF